MAATRRWLKIGAGAAAGVTTILGLFVLLQASFGFVITDLTGDFVCAGTYASPCISEFQVRNPTSANVDIYSKEQVKLDFNPDIEDWALFVPDGRCTATGACACDMKNGEKIGYEGWRCVDFTNKTKPRKDKVYNFRFKRYSTTVFKLVGIKKNPSDEVKWGFGTNEEYLDPVWLSNSAVRKGHNFEERCANGSCTMVIYPGTVNVFEDNVWKHISEARSLKGKGFSVVFEEEDPRYKLKVVDFNYTTLTVDINVSNSEKGKGVPLKVLSKSGNELNSSTRQIIKEIRETIDFSLDKKLKFGFNSTTIVLQDDGNGEALADAEMDEGAPTADSSTDTILNLQDDDNAANDVHAAFRFNISSIPTGQQIDMSNLSIFVTVNGLDKTTEGFNVSIHRLYQNYSWTEAGINWNTRPNPSNYSVADDDLEIFGGVGEQIGWVEWDFTTQMGIEYEAGSENVSMYLLSHDPFGSPSSLDDLDFRSQESTTTAERPKLTITYSLIPTTNVSTCVNLTIADTVYNVINDLQGDGTCIFIKANGITLEGHGYNIDFSQGDNGFALTTAVNVAGVNNTLVRNLTINSSDSTADSSLGVWSDSTNSVPYNNVWEYINITGTTTGVDMEGVNHTIRNVNIMNITQFDLVGYNLNETTFQDIHVYGATVFDRLGFDPTYDTIVRRFVAHDSASVYSNFGGGVSKNTTIIDSVLNGQLTLNSPDSFFIINSTYTTESVSAGNLTRSWYLTVNVTDSSSLPIASAQVNISNVSQTVILSDQTTGADGLTSQFTLISYKNMSGTTTLHYPYNLTGWKTGYTTNSTEATLTDNLLTWLVLPDPLDTCTYASGNWAITASDNCVVTSNVLVDTGSNITCTGSGTFTINNGVQVTNFFRRHFEQGCYYKALGNGGFFQ